MKEEADGWSWSRDGMPIKSENVAKIVDDINWHLAATGHINAPGQHNHPKAKTDGGTLQNGNGVATKRERDREIEWERLGSNRPSQCCLGPPFTANPRNCTIGKMSQNPKAESCQSLFRTLLRGLPSLAWHNCEMCNCYNNNNNNNNEDNNNNYETCRRHIDSELCQVERDLFSQSRCRCLCHCLNLCRWFCHCQWECCNINKCWATNWKREEAATASTTAVQFQVVDSFSHSF